LACSQTSHIYRLGILFASHFSIRFPYCVNTIQSKLPIVVALSVLLIPKQNKIELFIKGEKTKIKRFLSKQKTRKLCSGVHK